MSDTLKRMWLNAILKMEAVDERHFEKNVVEWMTKEDKLQVMVYYLHLKISYTAIILYMISN